MIIAAGGSGTRMGGATTKQFLLLKDQPIIFHSISAFTSVYPDIEIIVVLKDELLEQWNDLLNQFALNLDVKIARGGKERFDSIKNGLSLCTGDLIAIHDAVRPLVSRDVIQKCFETAEVSGAVVPVLPVKNSLRQITFDESVAVNRADFREVQTPQVFKANVIKLAYEQVYSERFTDDASVVESCGHDVVLVEGNEENIKITSPVDLKIAHLLVQQK